MIQYPSFVDALTVSRSRGRLGRYPFLWDGLAGYWSMLQGGGVTIFDLSGYNNHASLFSGMDPATDWVVTEKGWAIDFDGFNDRILFDRDIVASRLAATLMTRVRFSSTSRAADRLWSNSGTDSESYIQMMGDLNRWQVETDTAANILLSEPGIPDTDWHTACFVFRDSHVLYYLDGVAIDDDAGMTDDITFNRIGMEGSTTFSGLLADFGFWNRALAPSEIKLLYDVPHAITMLRPMAYPLGVEAGPSFNPAWAEGLNTYIGAT